MSECSVCGRPFAANGCGGCHRSKSGAWPVRPVIGTGQGGPGLKRGPATGRPYQLSFKLDEHLASNLRGVATERGQALGRVVRDLIEDGLRYRRLGERDPSGITDAKRAVIKELSQPGTDRQEVSDRLRPVLPGGGFFER